MRAYCRLAALAVALSLPLITPAAAQSFFESLFGGFQSKSKETLPPAMPSYRAPMRTPMSRVEPSEHTTARRSSAPVRTVCVRLCDGYYFPISSRTPADRISVDSSRCKSSCGSNARLFYTSELSDDPAAMTDVTGRRYDSLDTAFAYRKKLIPGCACKPVPWSSVERQRHMTYAAEVAAASLTHNPKSDANGDGNGQSAAPENAAQKVAETGTAAAEPPPLAPPSAIAEGREQPPIAEMVATPARRRPGERTRHVTSDADDQRPRRLRDPRPAATRVTNAASSGSGGFLNFGKPKYVWPGDPR